MTHLLKYLAMLVTLLIIHAVLCVCLVGLVLLQQGKGADIGASLSGGSNSVFGAGGAVDFVAKLTTGLAIAFMCTSILLVRTYNSKSSNPILKDQDSVLAGSLFDEKDEVSEQLPSSSSNGVIVTPTSTSSSVGNAEQASVTPQLVTPPQIDPLSLTAESSTPQSNSEGVKAVETGEALVASPLAPQLLTKDSNTPSEEAVQISPVPSISKE